jgi:hypothetical protein
MTMAMPPVKRSSPDTGTNSISRPSRPSPIASSSSPAMPVARPAAEPVLRRDRRQDDDEGGGRPDTCSREPPQSAITPPPTIAV